MGDAGGFPRRHQVDSYPTRHTRLPLHPSKQTTLSRRVEEETGGGPSSYAASHYLCLSSPSYSLASSLLRPIRLAVPTAASSQPPSSFPPSGVASALAPIPPPSVASTSSVCGPTPEPRRATPLPSAQPFSPRTLGRASRPL